MSRGHWGDIGDGSVCPLFGFFVKRTLVIRGQTEPSPLAPFIGFEYVNYERVAG